jgi:hypothetical protein
VADQILMMVLKKTMMMTMMSIERWTPTIDSSRDEDAKVQENHHVAEVLQSANTSLHRRVLALYHRANDDGRLPGASLDIPYSFNSSYCFQTWRR